MYKHILSAIIVLCILFSMSACGNSSDATSISTIDAADLTEPTTNVTENETTAPVETPSSQVEVDENLLTVDLTFPASYFGDMDMSTFDTDAYVKEYGFISAEVYEDGSLHVLMTKTRQRELLNEMITAIDQMIADYINGEETPYIKEIVHNDDYSSFTMKVKRNEFINSFDVTETSLILSLAFYNMYAGVQPDIQFTTINVDTGEVISFNTY